MKAIINGKIIENHRIYTSMALVFDTNIVEITDCITDSIDELIDAKGQYISAGFIDCHIHGYGGHDTMSGNITPISEKIIENGVTSFLPTTMTMSQADIYNALDKIKSAKNYKNGARILGCHLEGPFIDIKKKGAQDPAFIRKPDFDFIKDYADIIKTVTYAPEHDTSFNFLSQLVNHNISASVGHTSADYQTARGAFSHGANCVTHFFNAMPPLHHRDPAVIGAAFENQDVFIELIADTIHVHPALFSMLYTLKADKLCLITDCIEAGGLENGKYSLGGQPVTVLDGRATLEDGTLAGSVLKMNKAVYNFMKNTGLNIEDVIPLATINPAKRLGLDSQLGSLHPGKKADIIIFDSLLNIKSVFRSGNRLI